MWPYDLDASSILLQVSMNAAKKWIDSDAARSTDLNLKILELTILWCLVPSLLGTWISSISRETIAKIATLCKHTFECLALQILFSCSGGANRQSFAGCECWGVKTPLRFSPWDLWRLQDVFFSRRFSCPKNHWIFLFWGVWLCVAGVLASPNHHFWDRRVGFLFPEAGQRFLPPKKAARARTESSVF